MKGKEVLVVASGGLTRMVGRTLQRDWKKVEVRNLKGDWRRRGNIEALVTEVGPDGVLYHVINEAGLTEAGRVREMNVPLVVMLQTSDTNFLELTLKAFHGNYYRVEFVQGNREKVLAGASSQLDFEIEDRKRWRRLVGE